MKPREPKGKPEWKTKKMVCELFPDIPAANINHYVQYHSNMSIPEIIAHFLYQKEATGQINDIKVLGYLTQARQLMKDKEKEEVFQVQMSEENKKMRLEIARFTVDQSLSKFTDILYESISQTRLSKKRPKIIPEDYLNSMAFYIANEIKEGNISLDNIQWEKYQDTNQEPLIDPLYAAGYFVKTADPLTSIIQIVTHEPKWKTLVFSSLRYCGIGAAFNNNDTLFLVMIAANLE